MAAAFNHSTLNKMQSAVRTLFYRRQLIGKLKLTTDEYLQTFVPDYLRTAFSDCAGQIAKGYVAHRWELNGLGDKVNATLRANLVPVPKVLHIQLDAPTEIVKKITDWAERGGDVSREFGRVMKVLEILNENYSRVAIRYYWPTVLAILSEAELSPLVQELQELRAPVKLKPLLPGLPYACKQTAETIATTRLIPKDVEAGDDGDIVIDIVAGQRYNEAFAEFGGLQ